MIGSKAEVTLYYETVANHSLATPSASDSHCFVGLARPTGSVKIKFCTEIVKRFKRNYCSTDAKKRRGANHSLKGSPASD